MERPLISVILLCYRNYRFIFDCINSVLCQDYPNIEMIISNDNSDDFDVDELTEFFKDYQTKYPNIKNIIINKNPKNTGTTKHVNSMVKRSSGKYFKLLAVDDLFLEKTALSQYVDYLDKSGAYFVTTRVAMYDEELKRFANYYPSYELFCILKSGDNLAQFRQIVAEPTIAAPGVCFARKYIDDFGYFNESYRIADDWPAWINYSQKGNIIHTLDDILVIYRLGGMSSANPTSSDANQKTLTNDEYYTIMKRQSMPYLKQMGIKKWLQLRFLCGNYYLDSRTGYERLRYMVTYYDVVLYLIFRSFRSDPRKPFLVGLFSMLFTALLSNRMIIDTINNSVYLGISKLLSGVFIVIFGIFCVFKIGEVVLALVRGHR